MTVRKIKNIIRTIIFLSILIIAILHPRIIYWVSVIICGIGCLVCYKSKKEKTLSKMCKDIIDIVIGIAILCYCGQYLNIIYPNHAGYEYKRDVEALKAKDLEEYYYFPDKLPKGASQVKWVCFPNFIRTGYHKLSFYANDAYLQEIQDTFEKDATIYTYDYEQYTWTNHSLKKDAEVPFVNGMDESEKKNIEVFMLYNNQYDIQDMDDLHNGGFYMNQTEGYICFWAQ